MKLSSEMHLDVNVLSLLVVHKIMNNHNVALIVTKESGGVFLRKTELFKNHPHPCKVLPNKKNTSIFDIYGGYTHNLRLLGTQRN
jgi:hypothetical protein